MDFDSPDSGVRAARSTPAIPAPGLIQRLASADLAHWEGRRFVAAAVIAGLLLMAGATVWLLRDSLGWSSPPAYMNQDVSIDTLVRQASLADAGPLDAAITPDVAPVDYFQIAPDTARRVNALIPYSKAPNIPARPFLFTGTPVELERAQTCLAMAAFYEAGDDVTGQAAVVQVILNRLRHPAFPKSVCGVVLQGAERATGCQFTFTCDGSMARRAPTAPAVERARSTARNALNGSVFGLVGTATHYHTDFVLPRWSAQMDKIIFFHGHIFFRWRGGWGQPRAFNGQYAGPERLDPRFVRYAMTVSPPTDAIAALQAPQILPPLATNGRPTVQVAGVGMVETTGGVIRSDESHRIYYVHLLAGEYPGSYAVTAWKICAGKSPCTVYGWTSAADIPQQISATAPGNVVFSFHKQDNGAQQSLWNCQKVTRNNPAQCLPGTAALAVAESKAASTK